MKHSVPKIIIILTACLAASVLWFLQENQPQETAMPSSPSPSPSSTPYVLNPNEVPLSVPVPSDLEEIPAEMKEPCEKAGTLEYFDYETQDYSGDQHILQKKTLVYLPYGYNPQDQNKRYEMIYLMYDAGQGLEFFLGSPEQPGWGKNMVDHLNAEGKIRPSILVLCDYYPGNQVAPAADGDASYAKNFVQELHHDLIPSIESHYRSFAETVDEQGLKDTRSHRLFGGYGMGAVCTWYRLMDSLDDFAYFLPMSGSFWSGTEAVVNGLSPAYFVTEQLYYPVLTSGYRKTEFFVFGSAGSEESRKSECDEQFRMMAEQTDVWSVSGEEQNLLYLPVNGAGYDVSNPLQVLYTALPFFTAKMPS